MYKVVLGPVSVIFPTNPQVLTSITNGDAMAKASTTTTTTMMITLLRRRDLLAKGERAAWGLSWAGELPKVSASSLRLDIALALPHS